MGVQSPEGKLFRTLRALNPDPKNLTPEFMAAVGLVAHYSDPDAYQTIGSPMADEYARETGLFKENREDIQQATEFVEEAEAYYTLEEQHAA